MARRVVPVQALVEVGRRWQAGDGVRRIARDLGVHRETVRKLLRAAEERGWRREGIQGVEQWGALAREVFGDPADRARRARLWEGLEGRRAEIEIALRSNRVVTVWGRMRAAGLTEVSLSTFRRYVWERLPPTVQASEVVVHGPEATPGEWAEVDFGALGYWTRPADGKRKRLWAFVMVLAYSRHMFVRPVLAVDGREWLRCHLMAFSFFGGVPRRLVVDNLKGGVIKPDLYDPEINRSYAEMAHHFGVLVDPARSLHPKDKPRVERAMPYVREHLYHGREAEFTDLEAAPAYCRQWCLGEAGKRTHGTTRRQPLEMFQREEAAELIPLPPDEWEACTWERRRVAPDAHCTAARALYSVPYRLIGRDLDVRITDQRIEFYDGAELVRTHSRVAPRRRSTNADDLPADRTAFYMRNPQWCLHEAERLGPAVHAVAAELLRVETLTHLRQVQGVLHLAERHGPARLAAACDRALIFGDPRYVTIRNILRAGLERTPAPIPLFSTSPAAGAFLRGPAAFAVDGYAPSDVTSPTSAPVYGEQTSTSKDPASDPEADYQ